MMKKGMYGVLFVGLFWLTPVFAYLDGDFSLRMMSDKWDYIWQGKNRSFSSDDGDFLDFRKNYEMEEDSGYMFSVTSFSLGSPLNFSFESSAGKLPRWLAYPAKRFPFNDPYHGIDVSGDGRWCNTLLWWFYVHEFVLWSDNIVQKAAIDFVQYCEEGTAGLYGSLRYNSSVASSCTENSCAKVKELVVWKTTTSSSMETDNESISENEKEIVINMLKKVQQKYPLFYNDCVSYGLLDEDDMPIDDNGMFNINACKGKYSKIFMFLNKFFEKFRNNDAGSQVESLSPSQIKELLQWFDTIITKIDIKREQLTRKGRLTNELDIVLSTIAYFFEVAKIWLSLQ